MADRDLWLERLALRLEHGTNIGLKMRAQDEEIRLGPLELANLYGKVAVGLVPLDIFNRLQAAAIEGRSVGRLPSRDRMRLIGFDRSRVVLERTVALLHELHR